ncbi:MAG: DUF4981 domain-containing protein, partial [Clostridiales bacterium]|nr:DUF4981 domain-containing protein [Clostridiales bacterium]
PCGFMWSLGNEAGDGDNFMRMKEAALKLDDTRQFHYEGDFDLTKSDVISRMYPVESVMKKLGRREEITTSLYDNVANSLAADNKPIKPEMYKGKPVLLCEYAHAMENSLGNFQEYIDDFDQYDNMCGGFIWDFVDQAIRRTGPDGQAQWLYGTDFEKVEPRRKLDIPNTTAMTGSSTYFCANGIIGADRSLQPSIHQVKKGYQYLVAEQKSALHHIYTIRNKYLFTDLSGFTVKWAVHAAGDEVQSGVIEDCNVPPLGEADVVIPYREDSLPDAECTLTISFLTGEDTPWSEAGYEQAWDQFIIRSQPKMKLAKSKHYAPSYRQSGNTVTVEGDGFCVTIDGGCVGSMVYGGEELLTAPMRPNFYRALTDNDIDYFNFVPPLMKVHPKLAWKLATRTLRPAKVFARQDDQGAVQVAVNWTSEFLRELRSDYIVYPDGRMLVHLSGIPRFLNMVRFGMQMGLDGAYQYAAWYGRGPHETYCDRKTGAKIGKYAMAVADLEHRYMRPQENGNRTDVRMVAFLDEAGHGLRFTAHYDNPIDFSAHYYDTETLDKATHLHTLEYSRDITVNIDHMQCGVGGDMPGAACLREPYIMRAGRPYSYSFLVEKI